MNKIKRFITKHKILILLILLALLLRLPWLYTTLEQDEGIFGHTAWRALSGDPLYCTEDNKPPLLYLLYILPISIFGNSIIPVRLFNNLLFFISIIFFFSLVKKEYGKKFAIPSSIFYILFMNLPALEGPLAVSESFMVPFFIIAIYFFCLFFKKQKYLYLVLSIILMCIASLIRHNALGGLLLIYFLLFKKKKIRYKEVFFLNIPVILFSFLVVYFSYTNQISNLLTIILKTYRFRLPVAFEHSLLAILESSFILLFTSVGLMVILKKKQIKKYLLTILWLLFLIPFLFFPTSFHHLLTFAPPLAIFAGIGFNFVLKRKKERSFMVISILLLILSLFLIIKQYPDYHFRFGKNGIIYSDLENYKTLLQISKYLKNITSVNETILMLGWEPGIYWLSERKPFTESFYDSCRIVHQLSTSQEPSIKEVQRRYPKTMIFFPGYKRQCKNITEKIFSNILLKYDKIEIGNVKIYTKD